VLVDKDAGSAGAGVRVTDDLAGVVNVACATDGSASEYTQRAHRAVLVQERPGRCRRSGLPDDLPDVVDGVGDARCAPRHHPEVYETARVIPEATNAIGATGDADNLPQVVQAVRLAEGPSRQDPDIR